MKATVSEVLKLQDELDGIKQRLRNVSAEVLKQKGEVEYIPFRFSERLARATKKVKSFEIDQVESLRREAQRIKKEEGGEEYGKEYVKICEETGKKRDNGEFIQIRAASGMIIAQVQEGKEAERQANIDALDKKYKKYLDALEKINDLYREKLDSEVDTDELEFRKMSMGDLPRCLLPDEIDSLYFLLEDEKEEKLESKDESKSK